MSFSCLLSRSHYTIYISLARSPGKSQQLRVEGSCLRDISLVKHCPLPTSSLARPSGASEAANLHAHCHCLSPLSPSAHRFGVHFVVIVAEICTNKAGEHTDSAPRSCPRARLFLLFCHRHTQAHTHGHTHRHSHVESITET